jgi:succinyl-diaminopimelate desuccinylase
MHIAFGKGINAVVDAAKIINVLNDDANLNLAYSQEFDLHSGLGVIGVQGGGTMILAPELAKVMVDRHLLPGETLEGAVAHLHELVRRTKIECTYEITWDDRPTPAPGAFIVPVQSRFVQVVKQQIESELGREVQLTIARSVADVNHIAVHGGVPTITCGPWGGNTCEANEWVDLESLAPIARVHVNTVMAMLGAD